MRTSLKLSPTASTPTRTWPAGKERRPRQRRWRCGDVDGDNVDAAAADEEQPPPPKSILTGFRPLNAPLGLGISRACSGKNAGKKEEEDDEEEEESARESTRSERTEARAAAPKIEPPGAASDPAVLLALLLLREEA